MKVEGIARYLIARSIKRFATGANAIFEVLEPAHKGKQWTACIVSLVDQEGQIQIVERGPLSMECAGALETAIQMGLDWIAIEKLERERHDTNGSNSGAA